MKMRHLRLLLLSRMKPPTSTVSSPDKSSNTKGGTTQGGERDHPLKDIVTKVNRKFDRWMRFYNFNSVYSICTFWYWLISFLNYILLYRNEQICEALDKKRYRAGCLFFPPGPPLAFLRPNIHGTIPLDAGSNLTDGDSYAIHSQHGRLHEGLLGGG